MKNEKGITLIALIITIIVMLILVAVTINVAINGGLFGEASKASTGTEEEAIYDQIVSAMVLEDKGILNVSETAKAAIADLKSKGYTVTPEEVSEEASEVTLTVTGRKGTYKYKITGERIEIIEEGKPGGETASSDWLLIKVTDGVETMDVLAYGGNSKLNINSNEITAKVYTAGLDCINMETMKIIKSELVETEENETFHLSEIPKELILLVEGSTITEVEIAKDVIDLIGNDIVLSSFGELFEGEYNVSIETVILPEGITRIPDNCCDHCAALVNVNIPNSVVEIGEDAFNKCSNLVSISIPDNVTIIGDGAFAGCEKLTNITIPSGVTIIWEGTFNNCKSLTNITIPKAVTKINKEAFSGCTSLENIYFDGTIEEWNLVEIYKGGTFTQCPTDIVHCTDGDTSLLHS